MKKVTIMLLIVSMLLLLLPTSASQPSSWARTEVEAFYNAGLMPPELAMCGYQDSITRLDFCILVVRMYRLLSLNPVQATIQFPFEDTTNVAVVYAYQLGIVSGVGDNQFAPDRLITRQEIAHMFNNLVKVLIAEAAALEEADDLDEPDEQDVPDEQDDPIDLDDPIDQDDPDEQDDTPLPVPPIATAYNDDADINSWARASVIAMTELGIMQGSNNSFMPKSNITYEEVFLMAVRYVTNEYPDYEKPAIPLITAPENNALITDVENALTLAWSYSGIGSYYSVFCRNNLDQSLNRAFSVYTVYDCDLSSYLAVGDEYQITVVAYSHYGDTTPFVSQPITIQYGKPIPHITVTNSFGVSTTSYWVSTDYEDIYKPMTLSWTRVPDAAKYRVTIDIERGTVRSAELPPYPTTTLETTALSHTIAAIVPNWTYTITITALDAEGKDYSESTLYLYAGSAVSYQERHALIYYDGDDMSSERMREEGVTVTIPIWKLSNGNKTASTATLRVNKQLATMVVEIFTEIFNGPEQFPIKSVGGFYGTGNAEHGRGYAIDINPNENYCIYSSGTVVGSFWKPYEDPYSITPYGDVVTAFERRGWFWGGDSWYSTVDYMHFQFM